ncbi:MAG TPA: type II secretion system protein GspN, partial [Oligoflexia bacterium]|nr:type II secretion system protein GspN [Oligoflexia bacterium]
FLIFKFPEGRIQNYLIAHARIVMQNEGLSFAAEKVSLSFIFGPAVKFYNIEIRAIDDDSQILKIPFLKIRPKISSLIFKNKKLGISAELLGGELSGTVGAGASGSMLIDLDVDRINLALSTLVKRYTIVELKGEVDGKVEIDFDGVDPSKTEGIIALKLKNIQIPDQIAYGFNLPTLNIKQCVIDIPIGQGKADFRLVECGKDVNKDDIIGNLSGQITFDRVINNSKLNLRTVFQLSDTVVKAFPLLDALLASAKSSDGKYLYRIGGSISGIDPVPGG